MFKRTMTLVGDIKISKNFKLSEFICKEGKREVKLDMELVLLLQALRERISKPISVVSGYRSTAYNKKVGGARRSQHLYGKAADIKVKGMSPLEVAKVADEVGFDGIGVYPHWIHVDVRGYKARWGAIKTPRKISRGKLDYLVAALGSFNDYKIG